MKDASHSPSKNKTKILVTGATGFIGARVAEFLAGLGCPHDRLDPHPNPLPKGEGIKGGRLPKGEGIKGVALPKGEGIYDVYGLTRGAVDAASTNKDIYYISGDFGDTTAMSKILNDIRPNVIVHCAGVTPHNAVSENDYARVNFEGGKNLIEAIRSLPSPQPSPKGRGGYPKFINCSTIGVYGAPTNNDGVVHEDDICTPLSPYAQSKYDFERFLNLQNDIQFLNFRIANIPGRTDV